MADLATPGALGIALGELELAHGGFSFTQQRAARLGQADIPLTPDKQAGTQGALHILDLSAQGGWGNIQLLGGPREVAVPGNGQEVAEMTYFHCRISSKVMMCFTSANRITGRRR